MGNGDGVFVFFFFLSFFPPSLTSLSRELLPYSGGAWAPNESFPSISFSFSLAKNPQGVAMEITVFVCYMLYYSDERYRWASVLEGAVVSMLFKLPENRTYRHHSTLCSLLLLRVK